MGPPSPGLCAPPACGRAEETLRNSDDDPAPLVDMGKGRTAEYPVWKEKHGAHPYPTASFAGEKSEPRRGQ